MAVSDGNRIDGDTRQLYVMPISYWTSVLTSTSARKRESIWASIQRGTGVILLVSPSGSPAGSQSGYLMRIAPCVQSQLG
ncbi:hypothetical protein ACKVWM_004486 [Pyricularia oryzae]